MKATIPLLCQAHGLPQPEAEVKFHPTRKWRADWLWREAKVILEVEGGFFRGGKGGGSAIGGHSSGVGIQRDIDKANAAQLLGYRYFRCRPRDVQTGSVAELLKRALL
jgi:hypothetical protein